ETFAGEGQAGKARLPADVRGRELIERDAVAKASAPLRVRGGRQEIVNRIVSRARLRMGQPGHDREVVAKFAEDVEIRRACVISPGTFWKQILRVQTKRRADADHAPRRRGGVLAQGVEPGKGQCYPGGPQKVTAVEFHGKILRFRVIYQFYWKLTLA